MIRIKNIHKRYSMGETTIHALQEVSLTIDAGDFVAIMGPSGSGKSTLMHLLGLLDVPEEGSYLLDGFEVSHLSEDRLAQLRREKIGFIFQQFNLLPRMSALENVSLPLLYSENHLDLNRAQILLEQVGLGERLFHKSNELSGGQQQRVAIARALIHHPTLLFADEPTGNLDSKSQHEIMALLKKLNAAGITLILVTHEEEIGQQAKRLIRMRDGQIQSDTRLRPIHEIAVEQKLENSLELSENSPTDSKSFQILSSKYATPSFTPSKKPGSFLSNLFEHMRQGLKTLGANKVRTALSMLGILIGVAAVVAMLALGTGAQKAIEAQLSSLGSNLLVLRQGAFRMGPVALDTGSVTRLNVEDATVILDQIDSVQEVSPQVSGRGQVTFGNKNWSTQVMGTGVSYERMRASTPVSGRFFNEDENLQRKRVAVIGTTIVRELFGTQDPLGETIKINKIGFQVIGVLPEKGATGFRDQDDVILMPLFTAMHRLLGKDYVDSMDIQVKQAQDMEKTQTEILDLILSRHKVPLSQQQEAFQIRNMADIQSALSESSRTMSLLLSCIAAISLLVGGIGIMNIMLVSVTERTREIGLRKAVGAKRNDILNQFLVEALVVSLVGGVAGIATGWGITQALSYFSGWATAISLPSVLLAFSFSALMGIVFGIYPARKASRLPPIEALRFE